MGNRVFIIAEAGVNHNGRLDQAKKLVDAALIAGADAVKFQTFKAERLVTKSAGKAEYQKVSTAGEEKQLQMLIRLELDDHEQRQLQAYCNKKCIQFLSSPFDLESIDLLAEFGLETIKIPSGEITNLPYLRKIGRLGKKLILSTGMSDIKEIGAALDVLTVMGTELHDITVMHCCTEYPAPVEDANLLAMQTIREAFPGVSVGYSDHTFGFEVPIAAVALGAEVIEKHFTLDKDMSGPDHKASLDPGELEAMVRAIRKVELSLGDGVKSPADSELKNVHIVRKSIVAARNINEGEVFTEENITTKRPGTGLSPMLWDSVIGQVATRHYRTDEFIQL